MRFRRDFVPSFICSVGPDGASGSESPSGGGGGSEAASATGNSGSSSASPSGPTPDAASPSSVPPAPATPPGGVGLPPDGGDVMDFQSIFDGPPGEAPAPVPPVAPAAPVAPPPAPAPVAAQPAPVAPQAAPAAAPTPAPSPASAPGGLPALDPSDPTSIAAHLVANQDAAIAHIAQEKFKLSPEDLEALETDTAGTIPKLLARTFVEMQHTMLSQMGRLIPQMIQRQTEVMKKNAEGEDAFYALYPSIDRNAHGNLVRRYGSAYRSMHPQASRDEMFAALGPLVMMAAKIPVVAPAAPKPTVAPAASRPTPFVPAGGGGTPNGSGVVDISPIEAMFAHHDD